MARVFIETAEIENAVAVREAALEDGHEAEMVETWKEIERRLPAEGEELALVITGPAESKSVATMLGVLSERIPRPPVLAVVDEPDAEERRRRARAFELDECLASPPDPEEVKVALQQQLERYRLQWQTGIIGRTEAVREVLERVHLIAPVNSTVLITGESGTGKELVARGIHRLSPRRARPFIAMNCGAIPVSLLESELFGHEKGAFTGATSRRKGIFELADHGTLLLDEIAEMPPALQTRLLRVLETHGFMRVGGDVEIEVDVRVIAATNSDLRAAVRRGAFRRDLYYRLNVLHMELPALRERKSDIPILVRSFVREFSEAHDREFKGLAPEAMAILLDYHWPGNVRELRNLVESMVVLAPGAVIGAADIPPEISQAGGRSMLPVPSVGALPDMEPPAEGSAVPAVRLPQMEFIFHTLVEMKIDLEDLRAEFERFRLRHPQLARQATVEKPAPGTPMPIEIDGVDLSVSEPPVEDAEEAPYIRLSPEMTMADVERAVILIALREAGGNRRKAAERLKIGERTLYRKLREYSIEA
jgi:DNA-binding NtrC family response regulator